MAGEFLDRERLVREVESLRRRATELESESLRVSRTLTETEAREETYRLLFEEAGVGIGYYTPEGVVIAFNKAAARNMGGNPDDFIGKSFQDLFGERAGAIYQARIREVAQSGQAQTYEDAVSLPGGDMYFRSYYQAVRDPRGTVVGVQIVASDITDRKQAEDALRESEKRYRAVVEDQTEVICRFRADGTLTFVNEVYCRFFGKHAVELIGTKWQPLVVSEDQPQIEAQLRTLSVSSPVVMIENRVYSGIGQVHWLQFVNRGFFDVQGSLKEIQAVGRDVTALKQSEEALRRSEERYRTLFEMMDEGFCVVDMLYDPGGLAVDYRFVEINSAFEKHTGLQRALGKTIRQMVPNHDAHWFEIYEKVARTGEAVRFQKPAFAMQRYYDVFAFRIGGAGSRKVGVLFKDINERKQAEEALVEYQKQLQSLALKLVQSEDHERRRIAAYLHDQVGQSLAAVRVKFATWKGMKSPAGRRKLLSEIEQLIDSTVEETRTLTFELSPPILFELGLGPALEWLGETLCEKAGIEFEFLDEGHSGTIEEVVASALYRIARELLLNAVKHAHARRVSVSMSADDSDIRLVVKDDGMGMERFVYERALRGVIGTYGLFSIRERLRDLNGSLDIESNRGEGTHVTVTAPRSYSVSSHGGDLA